MNWFGYPFEVWIATVVAVLVKLRADTHLTIWGGLTTFGIGVGSGVLFYQQVVNIFGLGSEWHVIVACMITLTSDNVFKVILELSADREWVADWIKFFVTRRAEKADRIVVVNETNINEPNNEK